MKEKDFIIPWMPTFFSMIVIEQILYSLRSFLFIILLIITIILRMNQMYVSIYFTFPCRHEYNAIDCNHTIIP